MEQRNFVEAMCEELHVSENELQQGYDAFMPDIYYLIYLGGLAMAYNKITMLRGLLRLRAWANTEKGEKIIVRTLTTMTALGIIDAALLVIGSIF